MDPKIKKLWVKELRSGHYRQGKHFLCQKSTTGDLFCCLGVLMDVAADAWWEEAADAWWEEGDKEFYSIEGRIGAVPAKRLSQWGIHPFNQEDLVEMNDSGVDFLQIADWIEESL